MTTLSLAGMIPGPKPAMSVSFVQPYYKNIWEPLSIGYLGAYCSDRYRGKIKTNYFHGNFDADDMIVREASRSNVVAFSCTSPTFAHGVRLAKAIKRESPETVTVFGGWHVTALQEKAFTPGIDYIIVGEGEDAFVQLLHGQNNSRLFQGSKLGFNQLPWPDRKLIKNERTIELCQTMNGRRTASFQANRVCPVSCKFCAEEIMSGKHNKKSNPIRSRPAFDTLDEIEYVTKEYSLDYFKFVDATFDISAEYVIEFCKEKIKRGFIVEWEALIHAAFCTEEMMLWLKKAQCNQINVGVESGSDAVLRRVGKGTNTAMIRRVFDWAKKYEIQRRAFFILGMPNETEHDLQLTDTFIEDIDPDVLGFTILCPYPGCAYYDHEKHKDIDWSVTDEYSNDFWKTDHFSNADLKSWQKYFKDKYESKLCERQEVMV